jgi:hypothetical protein
MVNAAVSKILRYILYMMLIRTSVVLLLDPLPHLTHHLYAPLSEADDFIRKDRLSFTTVHPRSPDPMTSLCMDRVLINHQHLKEFFETTTSARHDLECWLMNVTSNSYAEDASDVFVALLQVVGRDLQTFFRLLSFALREISSGFSDDEKMQDRLVYWREFISSYQAELPGIKNSLEEFARWSFGDNQDRVLDHIEDLICGLDKSIEESAKAREALRAEMSILESKRGISEAESVSKLTELAFIFIPLTFAASLFSMQITPLQDPVPLWSFFVVCLLVLVIPYGIRLIVRSSIISQLKRQWSQEVRAENPGNNGRIANRAYYRWIIEKVEDGLDFFIYRKLLGQNSNPSSRRGSVGEV